jgi:predicted  nucleic acid-binding Zn-ribbon protein
MITDEKILKALENLQAGQARLENTVSIVQTDVKDVKHGQTQANERLSKLENGQAHLTTAVEAVKAGQDDIRDTMATQADVMDVGAKIDKITRNHERRIEELEHEAGLPNPHKH